MLGGPTRALAFGVAFVWGVLGGLLAAHYPLAPHVATVLYALWLGITVVFPRAWLFILPAALPVIGYASWTGWLVFEEFDALTLGVAAGGYWAIATRPLKGADPGDRRYRLSPISMVVVGLFGASSVWALHVGMASVGGESFGWFQGYHDRLNSLRVFKGFALAALLWPLLRDQLRRAHRIAIDRLSRGLCVGCAMASIAVFWERIAFPALPNFSEDYRVTAMFWETHVGGAALDGFLVLTMPFAIRQWRHARSAVQMAAIGGLITLIAYACLVTFSRGLYVALLVSMFTLALFVGDRERELSAGSFGFAKVLKFGAMAALVALASFLAFRHGGYRSLAATLGVVAVGLPICTAAGGVAARRLLVVAAAGAGIAMIDVVLMMQMGKGIYVLFALLFASCMLLAWKQRVDNSRVSRRFCGIGRFGGGCRVVLGRSRCRS